MTSDSEAELAAATRFTSFPSVIMDSLRKIIPSLEGGEQKGACGRIAVIGGSYEYTAAPYFTAMAALQCGADLVHVFCPEQSANAIKGYSVDVTVHPYMQTSRTARELNITVADVVDQVAPFFDKFDCLVVGPGLGNDPFVHECTSELISKAREAHLPLVLDMVLKADGETMVIKPEVFRNYPNAVITPSTPEFEALCKAVDLDPESDVKRLSKELGVGIVRKGAEDRVAFRDTEVVCSVKNSPRRCGGQGDTLAGLIAIFLAWGARFEDQASLAYPPEVLGGLAGCALTRESSRAAFATHKRATTGQRILDEIGPVFEAIFPAET